MHPNSCETLRSKFEKWFSITNVLLRFRQKRWGRGSGLTMSQVAPILLSSADRRSPPVAGARTTKRQKQQSPLSSFVHSQTGMFSNLIYNYVCILCGRPQKTSWLVRAKIMKNNLFSRQNPCYGLTITGGHGPLGWQSFVSRQRGRPRVEERDVTSDN